MNSALLVENLFSVCVIGWSAEIKNMASNRLLLRKSNIDSLVVEQGLR
jgi:hypothetical protein